jgi:hypothetical protein
MLTDLLKTFKIGNPSDIEQISDLFKSRNFGQFNVNETTYHKINNTIKRIIEVNKKLNHGTKSK